MIDPDGNEPWWSRGPLKDPPRKRIVCHETPAGRCSDLPGCYKARNDAVSSIRSTIFNLSDEALCVYHAVVRVLYVIIGKERLNVANECGEGRATDG